MLICFVLRKWKSVKTEDEEKGERKKEIEKVVDFLINLREKEREKVYSHRYLLASITVNHNRPGSM